MTAPLRWPLHPAPFDGEALSSWLHRVAASYQMGVAELVEHGLGHELRAVDSVDFDPSPTLLDRLAERTGVDRRRLRQMSVTGSMPALFDSLQAQPSAFDAYVRKLSVLFEPAKSSRHPAGPWRPWIPRYPVRRACPRCVDDPARQGFLLKWRLPLQLSCPRHGCTLETCIGFPGEYLAWAGDEAPLRDASETVLAMDRRSDQALATGQVDLPGRTVEAAEWFRLLRTILDELVMPVSCWGSAAADKGLIWASCGRPGRAGRTRWRPFEHYPWAVQREMLEAAPETIHLLENGTVTGLGSDAVCFVLRPRRPLSRRIEVGAGDGR